LILYVFIKDTWKSCDYLGVFCPNFGSVEPISISHLFMASLIDTDIISMHRHSHDHDHQQCAYFYVSQLFFFSSLGAIGSTKSFPVLLRLTFAFCVAVCSVRQTNKINISFLSLSLTFSSQTENPSAHNNVGRVGTEKKFLVKLLRWQKLKGS